MNLLTVAICSFNGAERLPKVLEHIANQKISNGITFDVMFVDNNCTDNSLQVVESFWSSLRTNISLTIIHEPRQGLCYAREAAIHGCTSPIIVFCDDDNWLEPDYLCQVVSIMESNRLIGALGGASVVASSAPVPAWFPLEAQSYAVGFQSYYSALTDVTDRGFLWGAGLALRTDILKQCYSIGVKPLLTGRVGRKQLAGDDSEICLWIILAGYRLYFSPSLKFTHFIPHSRLSLDNLSAMKSGFRASSAYLDSYRFFAGLPPFRSSLKIIVLIKLAMAFCVLILNPVIAYRVWLNSRMIKTIFP